MSGETMITPKEMAERLGVSDQTVYRWIASAFIRYEEKPQGLFRKRYSIPESEVERIRRIAEEQRRHERAHLVTA